MRFPHESTRYAVLVLAKLVLYFLLPSYLFLRLYYLATVNLEIFTRLFSAFIFVFELYFIVQTANYMIDLIESIKRHNKMSAALPKKYGREPRVAVFIPSYNEPKEILEGTVKAAMELVYGNKAAYILDDSTDPASAEAADCIAKKYGVKLIRRKSRAGYKAGALNDALSKVACEYVAVFDADQHPEKNFLSEIIPIMEADGRLAYVQTPQLVRSLPLAREGFIEAAAAASQKIFYQYICEGKGVVNAQFSCGSNVVYRREALESIGKTVDGRSVFFEEWCVTEDYATSITLQKNGWRSLYYTKTFARGLAPATMAALVAQRSRWAIGTMSAFKKNLATILFGNFSPRQKLAYAASGTYFMCGFANLAMLFNIFVLALFNLPISLMYFTFILFFSNLLIFYYSQYMRHNSLPKIFYEQMVNFILMPVYVKAFVSAMIGKKVSFAVTSKANSGGKPKLPNLTAQYALLLAYVAALLLWSRLLPTLADWNVVLIYLFWLVNPIAMLASGIYLIRKSAGQAAVCSPNGIGIRRRLLMWARVEKMESDLLKIKADLFGYAQ